MIKQVRFDYDELKDIKELKTIINDLKNTSEKLEAAKSFYNKYTNKLNDLIRKFPINIIAKIWGTLLCSKHQTLCFIWYNLHSQKITSILLCILKCV